ncbi:hypothetical protein [Rhodococcus sp. Q]|uniref:hypothetical protein n=1 Tax=Rhodococcus sp. Q TaxID=2502252 RepID=UPI0010F660BF|nr:hypothetical protein [Rhodococcus sp. Q]
MPHTYRLVASEEGSDLNFMGGPIDPDRLADLLIFVLIVAGYVFVLLCVAGWIRYASVRRDPVKRESAQAGVALPTVGLAVAAAGAVLMWVIFRADEEVSIFLEALVLAALAGSVVFAVGALRRRLWSQQSTLATSKEIGNLECPHS